MNHLHVNDGRLTFEGTDTEIATAAEKFAAMAMTRAVTVTPAHDDKDGRHHQAVLWVEVAR